MFTRCLVVCAVALLRGGRRPRRRRLFHRLGARPEGRGAPLGRRAGASGGSKSSLAPGAVTYWRDPGDSGAPPSFDFSGSVNLARAEPEFPAPTRIAEPDGSEAFGYETGVVFPIAVEALDPSKPVRLAVKRDLCGVRETLPSRQGGLDPDAAPKRLARPTPPRSKRRAPRPRARVDLARARRRAGVVDAGDWRLCLPAEPGPARDLFLETPPGWWLSTKAQRKRRRARLLRHRIAREAGGRRLARERARDDHRRRGRPRRHAAFCRRSLEPARRSAIDWRFDQEDEP